MENQSRKSLVLLRFSLYGFLKNQLYFEPFLLLFFVQTGLSYLEYGVLFAFRSACTNALEIPTGAVADVWGRRRAMVCSFVCYVASFAAFALGRSFWHFLPAMLFFGIGEAFRTGTHKAMIFDWLKQEGRSGERTRVYGFTRSWSKYGSAVSILIATGVVLATGSYRSLFWLCIPPYLIGIINFMGYPESVDGPRSQVPSVTGVFRLMLRTVKDVFGRSNLRGLVTESALFEGSFSALKDYIQPVIRQIVFAMPVLAFAGERSRTACLVGAVYFTLHVFSGVASRRAHWLSTVAGGDYEANRLTWRAALGVHVLLSALLLTGYIRLAIALYIVLYLVQNLWRPAILSRYNEAAESESTATVLSIESQVKCIFIMVVAPLLGLAVDCWGFWPVGILGGICSALGLVLNARSRPAPMH